AAVRGLLAFANVDFGQAIYVSDVYRAVENVAGVAAMLITQMKRQVAPGRAQLQSVRYISSLGQFKLAGLSAASTVQLDIDADGPLPIAEHEIPALGTLTITMREAPR